MSQDLISRAIERVDAENSQDPNVIVTEGQAQPRELLAARRLSAWVERLEAEPSPALRLAARCQHIRRWDIARSTYPDGRKGYLRWRADLAKHHAAVAQTILTDLGFEQETIDAVSRINRKKGLGQPGDTQTMEDALCLSFLEHEFEAFAAKHDDDKLVRILQKTWSKMSARAQQVALELQLAPNSRALIERALDA